MQQVLPYDFLGNPIYGSADAGAYEYQPPYTMGSDRVSTSTVVRVYGDEKFRNKTTPTGAGTANLAVSLPGSDTSQWLELSISLWNAGGDYHKTWTEMSSTTALTNTVHTVGDLANNARYNVAVDGTVGQNITSASCTSGVCISNGSGQITFTYTGGYSTHTFDVTQNTDDVTPPTPGSIAFSNVTQTTITATTTGAYDNVALAAQPFVYHNVTTGAYTAATSTPVTFTGLTPNTAYTFEVGVVDAAGNWATSTTAATTTLATVPGTHTITVSTGANGSIAPSGTVTVTDGTDQAFTITPAAGYNIATLTIDGGQVATSTSYTFSNVTADHTISATFEAVSVPPSDTTPPEISGGQPSGSQSAGTTQVTLQVFTNESATCKYGTTANTAYADIANTFGTTGGTTHTQTLTGLTNGTSYTYYVRCTDGTNSNTSDYTVSFSIANPTVSHSSGGSINPYYLRPITQPAPSLADLLAQADKLKLQLAASSFTRDLSLGTSGKDVKTLQDLLIAKNYLASGKNTGYFGSLTRSALVVYQKENGITPASGYFGPKTKTSLVGTTTTSVSATSQLITKTLTKGMIDSEVTALQQILQTLPGIYPQGLASGFFGDYTWQAVKKFQLQYNIVSSPNDAGYGIVGPKTRAKLNELGAR